MRLRFADPARCVIGILDAPKVGGSIRHSAEIFGMFLDGHAPATLIEYGDRPGNRVVFKRLGWLMEPPGTDLQNVVARTS